MYLVDTDVISAGAPAKRSNPALLGWMDRNSGKLYLSAITIAEIGDGIAKARREGASRKAQRVSEWLEVVLHLYGERVLPFGLAAGSSPAKRGRGTMRSMVEGASIARIAGQLSDLARSKGHAPGFADIAIAATAHAHGLTVLTRNLKHFASFGVGTHDPFRTLPH